MISEIARYFSKEQIPRIIISNVCVGVASYMGRSYLRINPSQAVLFTFAHNIIYRVGLGLFAKLDKGRFVSFPRSEAFARRAAFLTFAHIPHALGIISGVFSPLQVMTTLGLCTLAQTFVFDLSDMFPTNQPTK